MGFLDFLFGRKIKTDVVSCPVESDFSTKKSVVKNAFNKVMLNVEIPDDLKDRIYYYYLKARKTGDPRNEEKVLIEHLSGSGWEWEDFDRWKEIFRQKGEWPYMWRKYPILCEDQKKPPNSIKEALPYFNVKDMRELLRDYNIKPKPAPKKRVEFENAVEDLMTFEQLNPLLQQIYNSRLEDCKYFHDRDKCKLLVHTISMTIYSIRNIYQFKDFDENIKFRTETADGTCPVENEYAEKFNSGEIKTPPPFFPGDRTSISCN